ncbi:MAG: hypothetical protein RMJ16_10975 [Thermoguttaceae bacterium]|nr:hypothetical protein [Thermoguttaceae bacterium]
MRTKAGPGLARSIGWPPKRPSPGMTLLEVLISVFVLIVALLGLVSVLPLAARAVEEATRADRTQACGAAGLHELCSREVLSNIDGRRHPLLSPYSWADYALNPVVMPPTRVFNATWGYAIDPWLIAQKAELYLGGPNTLPDPGAQRLDRFPFVPVSTSPPTPDWYWPMLTLKRVTILPPDVWNPAANSWYPRALLQKAWWLRIFRREDDLIAEPVGDTSERPIPLFVVDATNQPVKPLADGNYTWLATISCEDPPDPSGGNLLPLNSPRRYRVSVVVFFKRQTLTPLEYDGIGPGGQPASEESPPETPPERTVIASILGAGGGALELRLVVPSDRAGYLENISVNSWIMLTGWDPVWQRVVHRWYKVLGVGDIYPGASGVARELSISGPDWSTDPITGWCLRAANQSPTDPYQDFNNDGIVPDVQVCLFDGAVGVYTVIVETF